jgi:hypothetical protein
MTIQCFTNTASSYGVTSQDVQIGLGTHPANEEDDAKYSIDDFRRELVCYSSVCSYTVQSVLVRNMYILSSHLLSDLPTPLVTYNLLAEIPGVARDSR